MSEIYEGEETATFLLSESLTVTSATGYQPVYNQDGELETTPVDLDYTETVAGGQREVVVDVFDLSSWPAQFDVHILVDDAGTPRTIKQQFQVVNPYVGLSEIIEGGGFNIEDDSLPNYRSYAQIREMEALARKVIEAYTGRRFYREYTKLSVAGTNLTELFVPREVQWIGLVQHDNTDETIYSDTVGSYVVSPSGHLVSVRDDNDEEYGFPEGYHYTLIGIFGPESVPYDIQLAAKQLAIHYLCVDSATQNKYVDQFKFGESQTRLHRSAFVGTGLRSVDLLLDPYRFDHYVVL